MVTEATTANPSNVVLKGGKPWGSVVRTCRKCGVVLPRYKGHGRPRKECASCSPPKSGRKVFRRVSRENSARHAARAAAARDVARRHPTEYLLSYTAECERRGVTP